MEKVTQYKSKDGVLFTTSQECVRYELEQKVRTNICEYFEPNMKTGRAESLLLGILSDPEALVELIKPLLGKPNIAIRKVYDKTPVERFWEALNSSTEPLTISAIADKANLSWSHTKKLVDEHTANLVPSTHPGFGKQETIKYTLKHAQAA